MEEVLRRACELFLFGSQRTVLFNHLVNRKDCLQNVSPDPGQWEFLKKSVAPSESERMSFS